MSRPVSGAVMNLTRRMKSSSGVGWSGTPWSGHAVNWNCFTSRRSLLPSCTPPASSSSAKPRLHDTTCCQTGCRTSLITRCIVYTNIQRVVKPVWQPVWQPVGCLFTLYSRLSNRLYNRLYRVNGVQHSPWSPSEHIGLSIPRADAATFRGSMRQKQQRWRGKPQSSVTISLRNDLFCVVWDVDLKTLTQFTQLMYSTGLPLGQSHTRTTVYGPFSGTTLVSRCQKKSSSGLYGARGDIRRKQTHRPSG